MSACLDVPRGGVGGGLHVPGVELGRSGCPWGGLDVPGVGLDVPGVGLGLSGCPRGGVGWSPYPWGGVNGGLGGFGVGSGGGLDVPGVGSGGLANVLLGGGGGGGGGDVLFELWVGEIIIIMIPSIFKVLSLEVFISWRS